MTPIVVCDFDGTITDKDSLACIFDKYMGHEERLRTESMVSAGTLQSYEQIQYGLNRVPISVPLSELLSCKMDPWFPRFYAELKERGVPLYIVSAGLKEFIEHYLRGGGMSMDDKTIYANNVCIKNGAYVVVPYNGVGIDKAVIVEELKERHGTSDVIFIGDGKSDVCVCDHVSVVFAKRGLELHQHCEQHGYCHEVYDIFQSILSHTLFRSKPLHVHFGFGNVTCGFLLDVMVCDKQRSSDICFIKLRPLTHHTYNLRDYRVIVKDGLFFSDAEENTVTVLCVAKVDNILKMLRLKECLTLSTAVGYKSFDALHKRIQHHLPGIKISAYENHTLELVYPYVTPHLTDRICYNLSVCDATRNIHVMTEQFDGIIYSAMDTDTMRFRQLCALKCYVLNGMQIFLALLSDADEIDGAKVFENHKGILHSVILLVGAYLASRYKISYAITLAYAKECIERLCTYKGDMKGRVLRNFEMKYTRIIKPLISHVESIQMTP